MIIKRLRVSEYLLCDDTEVYNFAIQHSPQFYNEENTFGINDIYNVSFGIIKDIQRDLENGEYNLLAQIEYAIKICKYLELELDVCEMFLDDFCRGSSWLTKEVLLLIKNERELLGGSLATAEEVEAGIDRFADLGIYLQIRDLANKDITKIDNIKNQTYASCFLELYTRKQERDFQNAMNDIQNKKRYNK